MAKRVGWLRAQALINKNGTELHPRLKMPAGAAGTQGDTNIIIGKNGDPAGDANPYEDPHATQKYPLGTKLIDGDRTFRYVRAAGTGIFRSQLVQAPIPHTHVLDKEPAANAAVGATEVSVTIGALGVGKDHYKGGYFHVNDGTGEGQYLRIAGNAALAGAGALTITLYDPLYKAIATTDSKIDLFINQYGSGDTSDHSLSGPQWALTTRLYPIIGVGVRSMTVRQYGWIQTGGPCSVLTEGTVVRTKMAVQSNTTKGAIEAQDISDAALNQVVGWVVMAGGDGEYSVIHLTLAD